MRALSTEETTRGLGPPLGDLTGLAGLAAAAPAASPDSASPSSGEAVVGGRTGIPGSGGASTIAAAAWLTDSVVTRSGGRGAGSRPTRLDLMVSRTSRARAAWDPAGAAPEGEPEGESGTNEEKGPEESTWVSDPPPPEVVVAGEEVPEVVVPDVVGDDPEVVVGEVAELVPGVDVEPGAVVVLVLAVVVVDGAAVVVVVGARVVVVVGA